MVKTFYNLFVKSHHESICHFAISLEINNLPRGIIPQTLVAIAISYQQPIRKPFPPHHQNHLYSFSMPL